MTESYTYPTPVQRAEVNRIIDDTMARVVPLAEIACNNGVSFDESVRMVKQIESARNYVPHHFETPEYVSADAYVQGGRKNIFDATERIPNFELDKHALNPRQDRHKHEVMQIERFIAGQLETFSDQNRPVASKLIRRSVFAIINTGTGMTRATYRQRRDGVTARLALPRWQLMNKVASGQLAHKDVESLQTEVDNVDRTAVIPDFYKLGGKQQSDIISILSSDARAVCDFATKYGMLDELANMHPQVLVRPKQDLYELHEALRNPRQALQQYLSLPAAESMQLMPVTNLKPGEAVRVSRSLLSAERFGLATRGVFLAAGLQLYQRFGDFYTRPHISISEWAEADPVKKLAQDYFGNFRQTAIQAAPANQDRARAVIPAYGEYSTPDRLIRRYFVTAHARQRGLRQPLPRAVETFVYVHRSPRDERATVSLATGRLIEGTQIVDELTKTRKLVAELTSERGMLKPIGR